jgi:hypothetical protein
MLICFKLYWPGLITFSFTFMSMGFKRSGPEADHLISIWCRGKNNWNYTSTREKTTQWGALCSAFFTKYHSGDHIKRIRWTGHVACLKERRGAYRFLVRKPDKTSLGRPRRRWKDNIKIGLQDMGLGAWNGLLWLRTGTGGGRLWMQKRNFGFHKMRGISWLVEEMVASQEGLRSME